MESPIRHIATFYSSFLKAFKSREVWAFMITGNLILFPSAGLFYWSEHFNNPRVDDYFDALWWAFSTVTTVGYGDIAPLTQWGRVIGIGLMIGGATCFVGFTAVFVPLFMAEFTRDVIAAEDSNFKLITEQLQRIERTLRNIEKKK